MTTVKFLGCYALAKRDFLVPLLYHFSKFFLSCNSDDELATGKIKVH